MVRESVTSFLPAAVGGRNVFRMTLLVLSALLSAAAAGAIDAMPARELQLDLDMVPAAQAPRLRLDIPDAPARAFETASTPRVSVARAALLHGAMQLADAVSTEILLANGGYERHPLLQDRTTRLLTKAAAAGLGTAADVWLQRRGKAKWFRIVVGAAYGGAVVNNLVRAR